ncbi:MAG: tetratricopeptide repeat protein [Bryobacterales bacterium]|nr:tetratricopeptide repeat protein [Bryobacterales bacterium]
MRLLAVIVLSCPLYAQALREKAADSKMLGLTAASAGDLETAAKHFGKACELAPKGEDNCYYFARTLHALARYGEARTPFEIALKSAAGKKRERVERAVALNFVALDRPEEAERHFRESLLARAASDRSGEDAGIDYGAFLSRQGRAAEAVEVLGQTLKDAPDSSRAHLEMGRALIHLGRTELAAQRLEKAVKLDPAAWAARLLLGKAYLELGRAADGERELRLGQAGWSRQDYGSSTVR